jgi:CHAD domain-containing protein
MVHPPRVAPDLAKRIASEKIRRPMQIVKTVLDDSLRLEPALRGPDLTRALLLPRTLKLYDLALVPDPQDHETWVHDVRVATRRYTEAIEMARPLLPPKDVERAIRRARKVRRRLGEARELDVVFLDFSNLAQQQGLPAYTLRRVECVVETRRRGAAQAADASLTPKKLQKHREQALALTEMNQAPRMPWRDLAADHLARRSEEADALLGSLDDFDRPEDHHRLRIRFKRLRYAVELADELVRTEMEPKPILAVAKRVQDSLGILNDGRDLVTFLHDPEVAGILGRFQEPLVEEASKIVRRRYLTARHLVFDQGARIVGEIRRAAGLFGRFRPVPVA